MKQYVFPNDLNYKSVSCGFECNNFMELTKICHYLYSIGCKYTCSGLYVEPDAEIIPVKRTCDTRDVWEFLIIQFFD